LRVISSLVELHDVSFYFDLTQVNTGNESHRNVSTPFAVSSSVACIIHSATEEETPKGLEIYGSCFLNLPQ